MRASKLLFIVGIVLSVFILITAVSYLHPNFARGFLHGRENYFYGIYQGALLFHGVSASLAILIASLLMLLQKGTLLHQSLGKIYVALVLFLAAPTGFYLAFFARGGWIAGVSFMALSIIWVTSTYLAMRGGNHRYWIQFSYMLACSAFALRWMILASSALGYDGVVAYRWIAWLCWLPFLLTYVWIQWKKERSQNINTV